jgi:dihydrofolate reductase
MAKLIYLALMSLDGYLEDREGNFDWAAPDEEVHTFINDLVRQAGTHLYGRRMYEVMAVWETDPSFAAEPPYKDFASIWQAADKIVYSRTLESPVTARTRIERSFRPDEVAKLKISAENDLLIGGPELASHAFRAGLVDECHLFVAPIAVGGGKPALPTDTRVGLQLLEERRFAQGMVFLRYACKNS